jgi:sarcosine oxidase subunit beta
MLPTSGRSAYYLVMHDTPDVLIIGAGIAGCSTAAHLLRQQPSLDVTLLDRGHIGSGSTSRSMAAFRHQWSIPAHIAFSRYAAREYEAFADRGRPVGFRHNGYLFLYESEDEWRDAVRRVELQRRLGVEEVRVLEPGALAGAIPGSDLISTNGLAGAVFGPKDGFLDPLAVTQAYLDEARAAGVRYRPKTRVRSIETDGERVLAVGTESGERIPAGRVLNCSGPWSGEIAQLAGLSLPVRPAKRYLYQTHPIRNHDVSGWPLVIGRDAAHFRPAEGNTLILAWETRPAPLDSIPPGDGLWEDQDQVDPGYGIGPEDYGIEILLRLAERVPMLAEEAALAHVTCGWYTITPDHKAILSGDPRLEGLYHATGFSGHGIMHGAATGLALAELVLGHSPSLVPAGEFELHFGLKPLLEGRIREPVEEMVL